MLLDKSHLLGLTAPEMTVLVGGLRSLGITTDNKGVFSNNLEKLDNEFFTTLLDMSINGNLQITIHLRAMIRMVMSIWHHVMILHLDLIHN